MSKVEELIISHSSLESFKLLDEYADAYSGDIDWFGSLVGVKVFLKNENDTSGFEILLNLLAYKSKWSQEIERKILEEHWTQTWKEDEGAKLTDCEFLNTIGLSLILIEGCGFTFVYHDGDLYYGHGIEVSGNLSEGVLFADGPI